MNQLSFRPTTQQDYPTIINLIDSARKCLKENGITQWVQEEGYPSQQLLLMDIKEKRSYILETQNQIIGTIALQKLDPTGFIFTQGQWLSQRGHLVFGRFAISSEFRGKGLASMMIRNVQNQCIKKNIFNLRSFTHEKNTLMEHLLIKHGYKYCGLVLYQGDLVSYKAFEKNLDD